MSLMVDINGAPSGGLPITDQLTTPETQETKSVGRFSKFNNFAGGWKGSAISAGLDFLGGFIKNRPEYSGKYGGITKSMDSAYDTATKIVSKIPGWGQAAGLIMGAGKVLNKAIGRIGGGTDGVTKTDAILGSNFLGLTPFGLINGFGGKKANTYTRNEWLDANTNGGFRGFLTTEGITGINAGKKYGAFSSGARKKLNLLTEYTLNMKHTVSRVVDTNIINNLAALGSNPFYAQQQSVDLNGGIQQMRAAKHGTKLLRRFNDGGDFDDDYSDDKETTPYAEGVEYFIHSNPYNYAIPVNPTEYPEIQDAMTFMKDLYQNNPKRDKKIQNLSPNYSIDQAYTFEDDEIKTVPASIYASSYNPNSGVTFIGRLGLSLDPNKELVKLGYSIGENFGSDEDERFTVTAHELGHYIDGLMALKDKKGLILPSISYVYGPHYDKNGLNVPGLFNTPEDAREYTKRGIDLSDPDYSKYKYGDIPHNNELMENLADYYSFLAYLWKRGIFDGRLQDAVLSPHHIKELYRRTNNGKTMPTSISRFLNKFTPELIVRMYNDNNIEFGKNGFKLTPYKLPKGFKNMSPKKYGPEGMIQLYDKDGNPTRGLTRALELGYEPVVGYDGKPKFIGYKSNPALPYMLLATRNKSLLKDGGLFLRKVVNKYSFGSWIKNLFKSKDPKSKEAMDLRFGYNLPDSELIKLKNFSNMSTDSFIDSNAAFMKELEKRREERNKKYELIVSKALNPDDPRVKGLEQRRTGMNQLDIPILSTFTDSTFAQLTNEYTPTWLTATSTTPIDSNLEGYNRNFLLRVVKRYLSGNKLKRHILTIDVATGKYVNVPTDLTKEQIDGKLPIHLSNGTAVFMLKNGTVTSDKWETVGEREHLTPKGEKGLKVVRNTDFENRFKSEYPGFKDINFVIISDPNFTKEKTGAGSIEYFNPRHDKVTYANKFVYLHPNKGGLAVVYNPNDNTYEDVKMDLLFHGMRDIDPAYKALVEGIRSNALLAKNDKNDVWHVLEEADHFYNKDASSKYRDPYTQYVDNAIDGILRNYYYNGTDNELISKNYVPKSQVVYENTQMLPYIKMVGDYLGFDTEGLRAFKEGGLMNVIPEGALHARLNHMKDVDEDLAKSITHKGIPVITVEKDGEIVLHAEIEHSEIIFTLDVTNKLEDLRKKWHLDKDDKYAIEAGKILVEEILHNTDDRVNLIKNIE